MSLFASAWRFSPVCTWQHVFGDGLLYHTAACSRGGWQLWSTAGYKISRDQSLLKPFFVPSHAASLAGTGYSMDDLLQPNGSMRPLLEVMSLHKPVNSEIENNFARAVSASKCSRGAGKTFSCFVSVSVLCCVDTFKPGHCQLFLKPFWTIPIHFHALIPHFVSASLVHSIRLQTHCLCGQEILWWFLVRYIYINLYNIYYIVV